VSLALALAAALPVLYWDQPASTAPALRAARIESVRVPPERAAEWREASVRAVPLARDERSARVVLRPPGIVARADVASASRRPWIDANGWRYRRRSEARYFLQAPAGKAVLAAAEAFAHAADLVLAIDPADLEACGRALAVFRSLPPGPAAAIDDLAVVDDGSFQAGELMNLLARRNLLFRPVSRAAPELPLTVELGSKQFPRSEAGNPDALALRVRAALGDEARLRLHLLNYGGREIEGLRVRLLGRWLPGEANVLGHGRLAAEDRLVEDGATEFSLAVLGVYAVLDLAPAP
jgi:hypothetical protein